MSPDIKVLEALQNAVNSYNLWASRNRRYFKEDELKGVVYNKMRTEFQTVKLTEDGLGLLKYCFSVLDMCCKFETSDKPNFTAYYLKEISFIRPDRYGSSERITLLARLQEQTPRLTYNSYPEPECFAISEITNRISSFKI